MKNHHFLLIVLFSVNTVGYAQNKVKITTIDDDPTPIYYPWLGTESKILTLMKLSYKKPFDFKEVSKTECFEKQPKLAGMFTCIINHLRSNDKQFIAFISIFRPFTEERLIKMQGLFPSKKFDVIDKMHMHTIKHIIKSYWGEDAAAHWKEKINYYPEQVVKEKFNADTVFRYSISLKPEDYYKKKFKYIDILFLQKKGRGYVSFYCFYTDKAKKQLDSYWEKIEGVLKYED